MEDTGCAPLSTGGRTLSSRDGRTPAAAPASSFYFRPPHAPAARPPRLPHLPHQACAEKATLHAREVKK